MSLIGTIRDKFGLSDRQLSVATKFARVAELWCASGVLFWGAGVAIGLGIIGLQCLGAPIPAAVGVSSLVFGVAMAAKSVVLQRGFHMLHQKGLAMMEKRNIRPAAGMPDAGKPKKFCGVSFPRRPFNIRSRAKALLPGATRCPPLPQKKAQPGPRLRA